MSDDKNGSDNSSTDTLPGASSRRWQPVRGMLLNIYRYDYEEFRYERGRLLLRGNNGTGKSRILALQLPFLLDGEITSHRLEPDGDPAKRMEWNLLLGKHQDRLGYTCIEFGRKDDEGNAHYLTLGCGLYAVEHRGIHSKWFFITSQRIGRDLFLANAHGQPLGKTQLEVAITGRGEVFTSAESYRQAIDQALFRLGDRYDGLLELLIRLRQPKLSCGLDEKQLSVALSDALPPLSNNVLADVAEAFGTLESDRRRLEDYRSARESVDEFLLEYRAYVQIAARRRAEAVRKTHSEYESTQRKLRKAETEYAEATKAWQAVEQSLAAVKEEEQAADEVSRTLAGSPQMRDANALADARRDAKDRQEEVQQADQDHQLAATNLARHNAESEAARTSEANVWAQCEGIFDESRRLADVIGVETSHHTAIDKLAAPQAMTVRSIDSSTKLIAESIARRRHAVGHLKTLNHLVETADVALRTTTARYAEVESQLTTATESHRDTQLRLQRASQSLASDYRSWFMRLRELHPIEPELLADDLATWCESGEGESPIRQSVRAAAKQASDAISELQSARRHQLSLEEETLRELRNDRERVQAGFHAPPPAPHTRGTNDRDVRPGAPLWSLCEFRPEVTAADRAALEAALEASGLLDACVTADGRLLKHDEHDTVLVPETSSLPPEDRHLGVLLVPSIDRTDKRSAEITEATVAAILRHIGLTAGAGPVHVDVDGHWQLGPLHGAWAKTAAQHIGHAARETERRRRLAELDEAIRHAEQIVADLHQELGMLAKRTELINTEEQDAPSEEPIRQIQADLVAAVRAVTAARQLLAEAEQRVQERRKDFDTAVQTRAHDAQDLQLSAWIDQLDELSDSIQAYEVVVARLWPTLHLFLREQQQAASAVDRAAVSQRDEANRRSLLANVRERAAAAVAKRDTLEATKGAEAAEVLAKLEEARQQLQRIKDRRNEIEDERVKINGTRGGASQNVERFQESLAANDEQRGKVIAILSAFVATRLLATAHPELATINGDGWSVTRAVEVARSIEAALSNVNSDDAAWEQNQKEILQHIARLNDTLLPHGYSPVARNTEEGIFVVCVPFQGRDCEMAEFQAALSAEIEHHQTILDAHEREVLENHLVGEVATHLHDHLHSAEKLVRDMSDELHARPTSTGMKLRFTWQPVEDGPPGLHEARKRLLGAGGTWSPTDRAALGEFLQQQIRDVRAANQTGTWQEHLTEAFDYRKWHQFGIDRYQDGHWKPLNKKTYGTGSSGEKAIALTLPLFAAAAASYRSADPLAPRLILLDEVFAGIDPDMRSKCMGLIHAFDLDFVMTSENEWGCYPTLPALAIYQLSTVQGIDAVGVVRWVWNGRERQLDTPRLPSTRPSSMMEAAEQHDNHNGRQDDLFKH